jgi:hypothetical protein
MIRNTDASTQIAYVEQQCLDGYEEIVKHAIKRKAAFDKKLLQRPPGEVTFKIGQLVQVYRNDLDYTHKTDRKIIPKWSIPRRIRGRNLNSYKLETLGGGLLKGDFSARRLRAFTPREGTDLARYQDAYDRKLWERETRREVERSEDRVEEETTREEETDEMNETKDTDDEDTIEDEVEEGVER